MKKLFVLAIFFCFITTAWAKTVHPCQASAIKQAKNLLIFHIGFEDERIYISEDVTLRKPIKNPVGEDYYDVLEVIGYLYKGQYRMRFIYAKNMQECLLMGQELLEYADIFYKPE